jgi:hypothetical protein
MSSVVFAQTVKNMDANIVSKTGSYWVIKGGDITFSNTVVGANTFDNLIVRSGASLNVDAQSDITVNNSLNMEGALTLNGNAAGTAGILTHGTVSQGASVVTAELYLTGTKWHLSSSPLQGQSISNLITNAANDFSIGGASYGMMDYNESANNWNSYFTSATAGSLIPGKAYAVQRANDGLIYYTGSLPSANVSVSSSQTGESWNLVGNPYPTAIGVTQNAATIDNFLAVNSNKLEPSYMALYVWDEDDAYNGNRSDYKILNNAGSGSLVQDYLQIGQGFFVKTKTGTSTIGFTLNMRSIQPEVGFKSAKLPWASIKLVAAGSDKSCSTLVTFNNQMTNGLDVTYDAGMFKADSNFAVYTRLVEDNGVDFSIQCLPDDNYENLVVSVGLDAPKGERISFTADGSNLAANCLIILEDRKKGLYTNLHEPGRSYTVNLKEESKGIGRFYLHASELSIHRDNEQLDLYQIITKRAMGWIEIIGQVKEPTYVHIYNLNGRLVKTKQLEYSGVNKIDFRNARYGIYMIRIENNKQLINKKINW